LVNYSPILTSPATVDTTCPLSVLLITQNIENKIFSLVIYPNPFTSTATITFGKEVHNATFLLYNLLGKKVAETTGINGESFQFNRGNLLSGVYVFEIKENGKNIGRGKAVMY